MPKKYYVDTSIWIDLHENRSDRFRPLGDWAFEFFKMVRKNGGLILYSDFIVKELKCKYNKEPVKEIFSIAEGGLILVQFKKENILEANSLSRNLKLPFGDCIHSIIARENKSLMVSRDRHFLELQHIVKVRKPEELI